VTINETVIDALEKGKAYVNVHTKKNLPGEVRGQVKVKG
jgi:CHRD domain